MNRLQKAGICLMACLLSQGVRAASDMDLMRAVKRYDVRQVRACLDRGVNPNMQVTKEKVTPLFYAVQSLIDLMKADEEGESYTDSAYAVGNAVGGSLLAAFGYLIVKRAQSPEQVSARSQGYRRTYGGGNSNPSEPVAVVSPLKIGPNGATSCGESSSNTNEPRQDHAGTPAEVQTVSDFGDGNNGKSPMTEVPSAFGGSNGNGAGTHNNKVVVPQDASQVPSAPLLNWGSALRGWFTTGDHVVPTPAVDALVKNINDFGKQAGEVIGDARKMMNEKGSAFFGEARQRFNALSNRADVTMRKTNAALDQASSFMKKANGAVDRVNGFVDQARGDMAQMMDKTDEVMDQAKDTLGTVKKASIGAMMLAGGALCFYGLYRGLCGLYKVCTSPLVRHSRKKTIKQYKEIIRLLLDCPTVDVRIQNGEGETVVDTVRAAMIDANDEHYAILSDIEHRIMAR